MRMAVAIFALCVVLQGMFWNRTHRILPDMGIVPDVPSEATMKALSFGDDEAIFRLRALQLQNAGDTFGRFTALYRYDFNKLYHWFRLLDTLNDRSNYLPSMATYYYSQTQRHNDVRYIIDYLDEHSKNREQEKWWWTVQASYLAYHKLDNLDRAILIAERLRNVRGIPLWAQQFPAFLYEEKGEFDAALAIIQNILQHEEHFTQTELNFMKYFAAERLQRLDDIEDMLTSIDKEKISNPFGAPDLIHGEDEKAN